MSIMWLNYSIPVAFQQIYSIRVRTNCLQNSLILSEFVNHNKVVKCKMRKITFRYLIRIINFTIYNRIFQTQTGAPNNNTLNNAGGNNNNSSSLLQPTQFGGYNPASSSASSITQPWGGAAPSQSSHQWQQSQNSAQYQPPSQYGQSQFGSNFTPNGQFGAPTSNSGSGFLPR